jgi:hypothetical protein
VLKALQSFAITTDQRAHELPVKARLGSVIHGAELVHGEHAKLARLLSSEQAYSQS